MDTSKVVGVFDSEDEVIEEIRKYEKKGVKRDNFSVLAKDDKKTEYLTEKMDVDDENSGGPFDFLSGFLAGAGPAAGVPTGTTTGATSGAGVLAIGPIVSGLQEGTMYDWENNLSDEYTEELDNGKILLLLKE
ncbi:general stress protein [Bacillus sp. SD088]|uniref:general stress protein n=1 Tax=Bacillus sp. SD088 TaxID=2782012 RepID=UPI001A957F29|nr:general stress protein [Bacillus sp. SD088]MBO0993016.1 general stress protein [Bacillus sp. SD088]